MDSLTRGFTSVRNSISNGTQKALYGTRVNNSKDSIATLSNAANHISFPPYINNTNIAERTLLQHHDIPDEYKLSLMKPVTRQSVKSGLLLANGINKTYQNSRDADYKQAAEFSNFGGKRKKRSKNYKKNKKRTKKRII
jgi:hypothetical protein